MNISTQWVSGGMVRTLSTVGLDGETVEAVVARHQSDLTAAMVLLPTPSFAGPGAGGTLLGVPVAGEPPPQ